MYVDSRSATVAEYGHDALTRRITVDDGTNVRRTYFSADWQALEERLDDSADAERQFVWGLRYVDDLVLRDRSVSGTLEERLYALQDANWNVTAIVDDDGDVAERYRYSAYGTPTFLDASFAPKTPNESDFDWESLYCGYRFDPEAGLYCVRWRYLNPTIGEWITRDLKRYEDGPTLYRYIRSSPLASTDPTGLLFRERESFTGEQNGIFTATYRYGVNDPPKENPDNPNPGKNDVIVVQHVRVIHTNYMACPPGNGPVVGSGTLGYFEVIPPGGLDFFATGMKFTQRLRNGRICDVSGTTQYIAQVRAYWKSNPGFAQVLKDTATWRRDYTVYDPSSGTKDNHRFSVTTGSFVGSNTANFWAKTRPDDYENSFMTSAVGGSGTDGPGATVHGGLVQYELEVTWGCPQNPATPATATMIKTEGIHPSDLPLPAGPSSTPKKTQ